MTRWLAPALLILTGTWAAGQSCTGTIVPMDLGIYTGAKSQAGAGTGTVTCTSGLAYNVSLGAGTSPGATVRTRKLTGPASATLSYSLYRDASRTQNWGNTVGTDTLAGRGTGTAQNITIYPNLAAGQYVAPGTYTDTINISTMAPPAATVTGTLTITATIEATCTISATPMAFGVYTGAQIDATSSLSVTCTNTTSYYVNLSDGTNFACCWQNRMTGAGGVTLNYTNYQESARTNRWGNTNNLDGVAGTGSGTKQTMTVYGRLFGGTFTTPGTYSDTVIAKITY